MAIPESELELVFGDTTITKDSMTLGWRVVAGSIQEIVDFGTVSQMVSKLGAMIEADKELRVEANSKFIDVVAYHKPRPSYDDLSAFDADLILDRWWQDSANLTHDVCGTIPNAPDGIWDRILTITSVCAKPPAWAWAEPFGAGQMRVKCVAVSGAGSYNVYDDDGTTFTLLDNVADAGWNTIAVAAGTYNVRQAALVGAQVGIMWKPITVVVE